MCAARKKREPAQPARKLPGLIDAHTHLTSCGAWEPEAAKPLLERAADAGVTNICTVGDGFDECVAAVNLARQFDELVAAVAIHPTRAKELTDEVKAALATLAKDPNVVAIGETGLDTYWIDKSEDCADIDTQQQALAWHNELAIATGKTLMIHNREADELLLDALADLPRAREVMLHCFSSPLEVATEAIARGYVLSFTGNVTFAANDELREVAKRVPPGQLLVETDAPYMTPVPHRGFRNEPAIIGHTALCLAEVRQEPVETLIGHVRETYARVFNLTLQ
ncbi:TatD family hydrolase [Corynebacterium choanae]|uniref:Putative deoxyribonuclease YcfH n=1 Tax=Corynebacterium choanae TaxID=1862358 RepID=A0A3G6JAX3_9CORY|nr:TatD family hydrolase [Corynebacterium choanae]AZA13124.1 putative deoxyribonuclease YcfH [Corynebacterium choanae]